MLGVAEEVGIGGQDLQVLGRGHGADQEIGRRALQALAAAAVAEFRGLSTNCTPSPGSTAPTSMILLLELTDTKLGHIKGMLIYTTADL